ncbi:STAS domain-containing protein [Streptomyces vinaceus]
MFTTDVQHRGGSVLLSVSGELDEHVGATLQQSCDDAAATHARDLMVDLHNVTFMSPAGLFHLVDLHRRAEVVGLRVLVIGWQPQPRQLMATVAGVFGADSTDAHRYGLAEFRRLLSQRT